MMTKDFYFSLCILCNLDIYSKMSVISCYNSLKYKKIKEVSQEYSTKIYTLKICTRNFGS